MLASLQMPIRIEGDGVGVDKEAEEVESRGSQRAFALGEDERGGVSHREDGMPSATNATSSSQETKTQQGRILERLVLNQRAGCEK